jgi:hypothetical protein
MMELLRIDIHRLALRIAQMHVRMAIFRIPESLQIENFNGNVHDATGHEFVEYIRGVRFHVSALKITIERSRVYRLSPDFPYSLKNGAWIPGRDIFPHVISTYLYPHNVGVNGRFLHPNVMDAGR